MNWSSSTANVPKYLLYSVVVNIKILMIVVATQSEPRHLSSENHPLISCLHSICECMKTFYVVLLNEMLQIQN